MSAIQNYKKSKAELENAEAWLSMIGQPYNGGGGGIGAVHSMGFNATIYSQAYNGAKNYHEAPGGFQVALSEVARGKQRELFAEAIARMKSKCDALAKEAAAEHAALMEEAGLAVAQ